MLALSSQNEHFHIRLRSSLGGTSRNYAPVTFCCNLLSIGIKFWFIFTVAHLMKYTNLLCHWWSAEHEWQKLCLKCWTSKIWLMQLYLIKSLLRKPGFGHLAFYIFLMNLSIIYSEVATPCVLSLEMSHYLRSWTLGFTSTTHCQGHGLVWQGWG